MNATADTARPQKMAAKEHLENRSGERNMDSNDGK